MSKLKSCRVPWDVSPTMSGLTLTYVEDDQPACTIIFGGNRFDSDGTMQGVRVELVFENARHARVSPKNDDDDIEASGFEICDGYKGSMTEYLTWRSARWSETGFCPDASFYVAVSSDWMTSIGNGDDLASRHYVISGRDTYVEVVAEGFSWREWRWQEGKRDALASDDLVSNRGSGSY